jgi:hypothetical protein
MPLLINENRVNRISGPVSMYILTPKRNDVFKNLPVYMLFGDVHNSNENICEGGDNLSGTYNIYDINFLNILNTLSTPEEPIDFYIEGGDLHNREHEDAIYPETFPMQMVWNLYIKCYNNRNRRISNYDQKDCSKNIRWQSGDARNFEDEKFEKMNCNIYKVLENLDFKNKLDLISQLNEFFKKGDYCVEKILNEKAFSFEDIIFSQDSLIFKQLEKFKPVQRDKMIEYIIKFCKYLSDSIISKNKIYFKKFEEIHKHFINFVNIFYKTRVASGESYEFLMKNWEYMNLYHYLLSKKNNIILDIYTICRSFKYLNSEGVVPIMNIIYCGNLHILNLVYFLENVTELYDVEIISKFDISEDYVYNKVNRCIEIKNDIDLAKIVMDVRAFRK